MPRIAGRFQQRRCAPLRLIRDRQADMAEQSGADRRQYPFTAAENPFRHRQSSVYIRRPSTMADSAEVGRAFHAKG